jgi:hypothetical protein
MPPAEFAPTISAVEGPQGPATNLNMPQENQLSTEFRQTLESLI